MPGAPTDKDMDAIENALKAIRLFRNVYASSEAFHRNKEEVCSALEKADDSLSSGVRTKFAAFVRDAF